MDEPAQSTTTTTARRSNQKHGCLGLPLTVAGATGTQENQAEAPAGWGFQPVSKLAPVSDFAEQEHRYQGGILRCQIYRPVMQDPVDWESVSFAILKNKNTFS